MSFSRGASRARVGVVSRASLSPETAENVVMQISGVIKFGAPMYNKGDARGFTGRPRCPSPATRR